MVGLVVGVAGLIRRVPIAYWAMDLNPDQLYALGKLKPTDHTAKLIESVNRFILRRSSLVITLDRFMGDALRRRGMRESRLLILPPWPHESHLHASAGPNPFIRRHGLEDKFVVMYSGNHSSSNPLETLLQASIAFKDDESVRFLWIGGGLQKPRVESFIQQHQLSNALSLPYQPLETLGHSLRAADVHVVSLGTAMVGVIHPCKIYGAMAVGRPVLFIGPNPSHIVDLLQQANFGWQIRHGDVDGLVQLLRTLLAAGPAVLQQKGQAARRLLAEQLSQSQLETRLCQRLEQALNLQPPTVANRD